MLQTNNLVCCCAKRQLQRPSHFLPGSLVGTEDASPADAPLDTKQHLEGMNLTFRRTSMRSMGNGVAWICGQRPSHRAAGDPRPRGPRDAPGQALFFPANE